VSVGKNMCLFDPRSPDIFPPLVTFAGHLGCIRLGSKSCFLVLGGLLRGFISSRDDLNSNIPVEYKYREVNPKDTSLGSIILSFGLSLKELYTLEK
jgi:hypothetical protein